MLALFVALGAGAYAATVLPANSVGARQLKSNAVERGKMKYSAVDSAKVRDHHHPRRAAGRDEHRRRRRRRDPRPAVLRSRPSPRRHQHPAHRGRPALAVLLPDKHAAIVTYCSNPACRNSEAAAAQLRSLGYTDVRKYAEGKDDWRAAGLALEAGAAVAA